MRNYLKEKFCADLHSKFLLVALPKGRGLYSEQERLDFLAYK